MSDQRPDPDQLLSQIKEEEARSLRGKLKIFFGANAGVGKTYAMLSAARQQVLQGVDLVIGVVETHGRMETEVMTDGLERLAPREIPYRDRILREFDLDAALARKPALILIDELAHSNVTGSRHPKRWQDVEELLAAGIDVYTTVNVQHLETLNDVVNGITGIRVWETLPDRVFDEADEVVLVDLPPDELLQRLKEGKVYLPHQAERAIRNFFRKGNLIALRELALRRTADRVDEDMLEYRRKQAVAPVWQTRESLLACIGPGHAGDKVVRSAARFANQLDVPWHAIYIETPELLRLANTRRERILKALKLAQEMGAETATLAGSDAAAIAVKYAQDHNLSKVVVGRSRRSLRQPWPRHFVDRICEQGPELDVIQVARKESADWDRESASTLLRRFQAPWAAYGMSALICGVATAIAALLMAYFDLANIVMLFLVGVVMAAYWFGRGPAVFASLLSVAAFDFFFVPPRFSLAVSDVQYLMTFAVMLVVGLLVGQLTAGLKYQARVATRREDRVRALYEMSRDLSGALLPEQISQICERFLNTEFQSKSAILLADSLDHLQPPVSTSGLSVTIDMGIAQWAFDHAEAAGQGTDTLPGSPILYLPLQAPMRVRGVLAIEGSHAEKLQIPEQRRLLDTFARLISIALERVHYVDVAQESTVQMESERLRNSLLSAISHDLRTPLSALVGLAESMSMTNPPLAGQQLEIAKAMREEALRMNALVSNLLDMARLQAGTVQLNRQWQPLEEIVGTALTAMDAILANHRVSIILGDELPLLELDAVLLERVFCNLLENAVKYTPVGSHIEIGAAVHPEMVDVWVADDGPGLPPGREEAIFNKFERGQKESATPGVGLGLAICRAIVEAHGGTIRAENRSGGGARFLVSLPRGNPPTIHSEDEDLDAEEHPAP
ncbi:MAG TPA: two-component system sensor histidine kinase KdpD [Azospira sp.]|nr:two-component system sensor histidine kinase KdpD [Azospira sp.]